MSVQGACKVLVGVQGVGNAMGVQCCQGLRGKQGDERARGALMCVQGVCNAMGVQCSQYGRGRQCDECARGAQ